MLISALMVRSIIAQVAKDKDKALKSPEKNSDVAPPCRDEVDRETKTLVFVTTIIQWSLHNNSRTDWDMRVLRDGR